MTFQGYKDLIDAVAASPCTSRRQLTTRRILPTPAMATCRSTSAGWHHMDGATALEFVRSRHDDPLGDIGRNERQQVLIEAVIKQMEQPTTWKRLPAIEKAAQNAVATDMPHSEMLLMLMQLAMRYHGHQPPMDRLTMDYANNMVSNETTDGGADVLAANWAVIWPQLSQLMARPRICAPITEHRGAETARAWPAWPIARHRARDNRGKRIATSTTANLAAEPIHARSEIGGTAYDAGQLSLLFGLPVTHQRNSSKADFLLVPGSDADYQPEPGVADTERRHSEGGRPCPKQDRLAGPILQVKVTLRDVKPPIWRRVPGAPRHHAGRAGPHYRGRHAVGLRPSALLHHRSRGVWRPTIDPEVRGENSMTLSKIVNSGLYKLRYRYDFGDGWDHESSSRKRCPPRRTRRTPSASRASARAHPRTLAGLGVSGDGRAPERDWRRGEPFGGRTRRRVRQLRRRLRPRRVPHGAGDTSPSPGRAAM